MDVVQDFEDMLALLAANDVRYLIVGGLAFIYHAKPRYTKEMDLWVDPAPGNIARANRALAAFGSPDLLDASNPEEIFQIGVAPDRIDVLRALSPVPFDTAWRKRIRGRYGTAPANWLDLDSLWAIKSHIAHPRHQDDARILAEVRRRSERMATTASDETESD